MTSKIELGKVVATEKVMDSMLADPENSALYHGMLRRHGVGDWGDLTTADIDRNNESLEHGSGRLISSFKLPARCPEDRLLIVTDVDRAMTTLRFPSEYGCKP